MSLFLHCDSAASECFGWVHAWVPPPVPAGGAEGAPGQPAWKCVCVCAPSTAYQEALAVCSWLGETSLCPLGMAIVPWVPTQPACPVPALCHHHGCNSSLRHFSHSCSASFFWLLLRHLLPHHQFRHLCTSLYCCTERDTDCYNHSSPKSLNPAAPASNWIYFFDSDLSPWHPSSSVLSWKFTSIL